MTLYWKNGKVATTDGPYTETKEQLGGILVFEARDMNHAVQLLSQHPALKYGSVIEIRPAAAAEHCALRRLDRNLTEKGSAAAQVACPHKEIKGETR